MEKYRIAFTVQDYYDYVGTSPYYGVKERMLHSLPELFKKNGYNIKFKKIKKHWDTWYRIHMSVKMSEEEIKEVIDWYEYTNFRLYNVSYKLITKHF
jgi:hypothetical protein